MITFRGQKAVVELYTPLILLGRTICTPYPRVGRIWGLRRELQGDYNYRIQLPQLRVRESIHGRRQPQLRLSRCLLCSRPGAGCEGFCRQVA